MTDEATAAARELIGASELLGGAYELASAAHAGQTRKNDGAPYVTHPLRAAELIAAEGSGEEAAAAALLHDVVEDSHAAIREIERRFGPRVPEPVSALTEADRIDD